MRTKSLSKNKINVVTLGCSKNVYDSEVLMGQLKANDKEVVHEEDGNIVVINTCGFIDNAKEESVNTILEYVNKKNEVNQNCKRKFLMWINILEPPSFQIY
jgi:ribosomal protein S12 methylthiotransferase